MNFSDFVAFILASSVTLIFVVSKIDLEKTKVRIKANRSKK